MAQNVYDQPARYAILFDPLGFLHLLIPGLNAGLRLSLVQSCSLADYFLLAPRRTARYTRKCFPTIPFLDRQHSLSVGWQTYPTIVQGPASCGCALHPAHGLLL
jgi:hypothetical protein